MPRWYDQAMEELEEQFLNGEITNADYREAVRDLNAQLRDAADLEAERAREDYLGGW